MSVSSPADGRRALVGLLVLETSILAAAAAVRIVAARDAFWLDEIWSLFGFSLKANSPLDVFTFHHNNNHYLVTLWMIVCGRTLNWFVYRIPSIVAGVGTVALATRIARRWGWLAAGAACLLTGSSYMLIVYSSEARGYALAGFFALAAFLLLDRFLATWRAAPANNVPTRGEKSATAGSAGEKSDCGSRRNFDRVAAPALFGLCVMLGVLSHLTFIQFYGGALLWSGVVLLRSMATWRQKLTGLTALHAVPTLAIVGLYFLDIRAMSFGGGDPYYMPDVIVKAMALSVGCVAQSFGMVAVCGGLAVAAAVAAMVGLWREKSDVWVLFATAIFIAPTVLLISDRPKVFYERYFYVNIVLFLVLLSYLVGRAWQRGTATRWIAIAAVTAITLANGRLTAEFLRVGRGHFLEAVEYMAAHSEGEIHVASNNNFDNGLLLEFYNDYVPPEHKVVYYLDTSQVPTAPEWVILISQDQPFTPQKTVRDTHRASREEYKLERAYPYFGLSGHNWAVYHRVAEPAGNAGK